MNNFNHQTSAFQHYANAFPAWPALLEVLEAMKPKGDRLNTAL